LQVKPHVEPLQVAVAFAGGVHAAHNEPHVAGAASLAHVPPQL